MRPWLAQLNFGAPTKSVKTVLNLDLVAYSTIGATLEESLDVLTAAQLNAQIQSFVDAGLNAVGAQRGEVVISTAGDSALLVLDSPDQAHRCAEAVHAATAAYNSSRSQALARRVFRSGAATGEIAIERKLGGKIEAAGAVISRAVRLETKANGGALLVDEATYAGLSDDLRRNYGPRTRVEGKREEQFDAYGCQFDPDGPTNVSFLKPTEQDTGAGGQETRSTSLARRRYFLWSLPFLGLLFVVMFRPTHSPADLVGTCAWKTPLQGESGDPLERNWSSLEGHSHDLSHFRSTGWREAMGN